MNVSRTFRPWPRMLLPSTGITSYRQVSLTYAKLVDERGGTLLLNSRVTGIRGDARRAGDRDNAGPNSHPKFLVNCGGLHSDRIARMAGDDPGVRIVPFRGEYFELTPEKRYLVKHLIYPVPNPAFPFLGVHFTRMIDGSIHAGPNAVLSFKREGYTKTDVSLKDMADTFSYSGFWSLAAKHASLRLERDGPLLESARLCAIAPATDSGSHVARYRTLGSGGARPGLASRRVARGRFLVRARTQTAARPECPFPCRHVVHCDREVDRGTDRRRSELSYLAAVMARPSVD